MVCPQFCVTDLAAGRPSLLLQKGYSRNMEREADAYALAWLNSACIPPRHFADILGRLDKDRTDSTTLLDSHPGTRQRLDPFRVPHLCSQVRRPGVLKSKGFLTPKPTP